MTPARVRLITAAAATTALAAAAAAFLPNMLATPAAAAGHAQAATITNGIWTVGAEIDPGTYQATTTEPVGCYWWRTETGNIEDGHWIGGSIRHGDQPKITLEVGWDFQMWGCGTWERVG